MLSHSEPTMIGRAVVLRTVFHTDRAEIPSSPIGICLWVNAGDPDKWMLEMSGAGVLHVSWYLQGDRDSAREAADILVNLLLQGKEMS